MTGALAADARAQALKTWLAEQLGTGDFALAPASADASFRRYFRVTWNGSSRVAMDAPPESEDTGAFIQIAALLHQAGVHAPQIYASDSARGYMLLEDLGPQTYLDVLDERNADALFSDAIDALVAWQRASRPGVLPCYDAATLAAELALFPDWYLSRHLEVCLTAAERRDLDRVFERIIAAALAQSQVFVHRDYMPRNLMVAQPNPGVLDFQDARYGPITYDLVSLFQDAFISWPAARIQTWRQEYARRAIAAGLPVSEDDAALQRDCDWMGLQRHLKVLGIFARICYRDGKSQYLSDAARFVGYVQPVLQRYPELAALAALFRRHVAPSQG